MGNEGNASASILKEYRPFYGHRLKVKSHEYVGGQIARKSRVGPNTFCQVLAIGRYHRAKKTGPGGREKPPGPTGSSKYDPKQPGSYIADRS